MVFRRFIDSFKPADNLYQGTYHDNSNANTATAATDSVEKSSAEKDSTSEHVENYATEEVGPKRKTPGADTALERHLSSRHMQMIAFGGAIGTGLFVGSGGTFANGGPGFVIIDFCLIGLMLYCVVMSIAELASILPVSGSFASYSTRFIDPAWGFAMGWNYWMQWFVVLPLELTTALIVLNYWPESAKVPTGVWILIFLIVIIFINLFGVKGYGEFEVFASMIKILGVIGFIIAAIVIDTGGAPDGQYRGAHTWHDPGAFTNGFKGFASIFVTAAFSFAGTELVGLAAAETGNPRKEIPKASKQVIYRILIFYILSLFLVSLIVPYNDPRLDEPGTRASPFVIALQDGQIKHLPSIFNGIILISVLSVGNSAVYGASRTLCGLSQAGLAPKIFSYIDREGRPLPAVILSLAFGFLAFVNYAAQSSTIFNWLLALSGLSTIFSWGSLCFCQIQFRRAWKHNGHSIEELPYKSPVGLVGAWFGGLFCILVICFQFYVAAFPIGAGGDGLATASDRVNNFFLAFLAAPVVVLFYIIYKVWTRCGFVRVEDMDINTGRFMPVTVEELRREREEERQKPLYKRVWNFFF